MLFQIAPSLTVTLRLLCTHMFHKKKGIFSPKYTTEHLFMQLSPMWITFQAISGNVIMLRNTWPWRSIFWQDTLCSASSHEAIHDTICSMSDLSLRWSLGLQQRIQIWILRMAAGHDLLLLRWSCMQKQSLCWGLSTQHALYIAL